MKSTRWIEITPSQFAWEREALDHIKSRLPGGEPLRAWSSFELIADDGSVNEVDLLVVSIHKVYLVEIKSWSGVISGDPSTWRREIDGNEFLVDNPLLLANRKAKKLISLLKTQTALAKQPRPYVEAVVFLSRSGVRCRLDGRARTGVYLCAESARDGHRNILDVLLGNAGFDPRRPPPRIDRLLSRAFARAMEQAGIRPSQRRRRVADYILLYGATPTEIDDAIDRARKRWSRHRWMTPLRDTVARLVAKYGGIMTLHETAEALAATRGSTETGDARLRRAGAVAAAALEMESVRLPLPAPPAGGIRRRACRGSRHRRPRPGTHRPGRRTRRLGATGPCLPRQRRIPAGGDRCFRRSRGGYPLRGRQTGGIGMIDRKALLADLRRQLKRLEQDLAERAESVPEMKSSLEAEYRAARDAGRTGDTFLVWRNGALTQAAVAWVLGCVFVRFVEDNGLVEAPLIAGGGRTQRTRRGSTDALLPLPADRLRPRLPAQRVRRGRTPARDHAPLRPRAQPGVAPWNFRRRRARSAGVPADGRPGFRRAAARLHRPGMWDTRFLGDLYQDLSEEAKKRYALLQTPEFVEEFILDRTLTPALDEFVPAGLRLIDPACGSGNFLYCQRLGDFFETYLHSRLSDFGLTETQLRAWSPPESRRTGRIRRRSR